MTEIFLKALFLTQDNHLLGERFLTKAIRINFDSKAWFI